MSDAVDRRFDHVIDQIPALAESENLVARPISHTVRHGGRITLSLHQPPGSTNKKAPSASKYRKVVKSVADIASQAGFITDTRLTGGNKITSSSIYLFASEFAKLTVNEVEWIVKTDNVVEVVELLLKERKKKRSREDLPDSSKPAWAEVNRGPRSKRDVKLRLPEDVLQLVNHAAEARAMDRTQWITAALLKVAQEEGWEISDSLKPLLETPSPQI